ncbi:unnamed protein product [Hapterophycus canaliculatus]
MTQPSTRRARSRQKKKDDNKNSQQRSRTPRLRHSLGIDLNALYNKREAAVTSRRHGLLVFHLCFAAAAAAAAAWCSRVTGPRARHRERALLLHASLTDHTTAPSSSSSTTVLLSPASTHITHLLL